MSAFTYDFPAVRGIFGGRAMFTAQVPVRALAKLFPPHLDDQLPPELRAQRQLDAGRLDGIVAYLLANPDSRFLQSLTAVIDGEHTFTPAGELGGDTSLLNVGRLSISMDAVLAILDGQHRAGALMQAVRMKGPEAKALASETVSIIFMPDAGLQHAQQVFKDINFTARQPPSSLGVLYDHRDALAAVARAIIADERWLLRGRIEAEKAAPAKQSLKLFSLAHLAKAVAACLGKKKGDTITQADRDFAVAYFAEVSQRIQPWGWVVRGRLSKEEVAGESIALAAVTLHALGFVGAAVKADIEGDVQRLGDRLEALVAVDFARASTAWEQRCLDGGKLVSNATAAKLVASEIKRVLELPRSPAEGALERRRDSALRALGGR